MSLIQQKREWEALAEFMHAHFPQHQLMAVMLEGSKFFVLFSEN